MKSLSDWLPLLLLALMAFALQPPASARAQSPSSPSYGPPEKFAPPPPGMPKWNTLIRSGIGSDLPFCGPTVPSPCRTKVVVVRQSDRLAHRVQSSPPPPNAGTAGSQHGLSPDGWVYPLIKHSEKEGKLPNRLPPAMVMWMKSPEYKQWAATHGSSKAYWHCWNPKKKEFYGVPTGSLQGAPPANCLSGPQTPLH